MNPSFDQMNTCENSCCREDFFPSTLWRWQNLSYYGSRRREWRRLIYLDDRQHWRDRKQQQNRPSGFRGEGRKPDTAPHESDSNGEFRKYGKGNVPNKDAGRGENNPSDSRRNGFIPTCFACGQKGHKCPECPNRGGRINAPSRRESLTVDGMIGKHSCTRPLTRAPN